MIKTHTRTTPPLAASYLNHYNINLNSAYTVVKPSLIYLTGLRVYVRLHQEHLYLSELLDTLLAKQPHAHYELTFSLATSKIQFSVFFYTCKLLA